ncbi:MAG: rhomboid family intramembrane serine protease [Pseudomonadota bacterium]
MHHPDHDAPPFNPVPPAVWALAAALVLPELIFQAGARGLAGGPEGVGWRVDAIARFGFVDSVFEYMRTNAVWPLEGVWRFVTYAFIHQGALHMLMAVVILLAMGNFTARVFHPVALVGVFLTAAAAGALAYGLVVDVQAPPLFGAYPAVYGLIGLYTWALWTMADKLGRNPWAAFQLIGILVVLQVIFSLIGGHWYDLAADMAGFATGFALATPAAPGGLSHLRKKLQGR